MVRERRFIKISEKVYNERKYGHQGTKFYFFEIKEWKYGNLRQQLMFKPGLSGKKTSCEENLN